MMRHLMLVLAMIGLLTGCVIHTREVSDENCGKMLVSRSAYLQCIEQKDTKTCEHLLRLYQADVQVFVASGCATSRTGAQRLMQAPSW